MQDIGNVTIRKGQREDTDAFCDLVLSTAPTAVPCLFGREWRKFMRELFRNERNYFSFEHSLFLEVDGETAGMALAYDFKEKRSERARTFLLAVRRSLPEFLVQLPSSIRAEYGLVQIGDGDCYLNSLAMYPPYRNRGLGRQLMGRVEEEAQADGNRRIVLDVCSDNDGAIRWYRRLGFSTDDEKSVTFSRTDFTFLKMTKEISRARDSFSPQVI